MLFSFALIVFIIIMSEIYNLNALCRCCHADGTFKNLQVPYVNENSKELYSDMLHDTFGISMKAPQFDVSYTICDQCISSLRAASHFKQQVLACERKFELYCKNELALRADAENVKTELEWIDSDNEGVDSSLKLPKDEKHDEDTKEVNLDINETVDVKDNSGMQIGAKSSNNDDTTDLRSDISENEDVTENSGKQAKVTSTKNKSKGPPKSFTKNNTNNDLALEVHVKTENGTLYSCKICGGSYTILKHLRDHIRVEHECAYKCGRCRKTLLSNESYVEHLKSDCTGKVHKCPYCEKQFKVKYSLTEHLAAHNDQGFQCDRCHKVLRYKQSYLRHLKWHRGETKKFMCDICGLRINDKSNLVTHILAVHEKRKLFACEMCGKKLSTKKSLKLHIRVHTGERPFVCEVCSKGYTNISELKEHKKIHDSKYGNGYKCKICEDVFEDRRAYICHTRRSHPQEKRFKCSQCGKSLSNKYSLKRHTEEHSGVKRFACDICDERFTQKAQLGRHKMRRHDPERLNTKAQCDICKRTVLNLQQHLIAHKNKPFGCELCEKRYSHNSALTRHVRLIHEGFRPFKCDLCDKTYRKSQNLTNHKMKKHKTSLKSDYDSVVTKHTIKRKNRSSNSS